MNLVKVETKKHWKAFVAFPYRFYKEDPVWIPPLIRQQKALFTPKKNLTLEHSIYALFLLMHHGELLGRIAAFFDPVAISYWKESIGLFGSYECVDDTTASTTLLTAAKDWLRSKGMKTMRGPWSFSSQEWGAVVEGFSPPPVLMAPYNPKYYPAHFEQFGLRKIKDLWVYSGDYDEGYVLPQRYREYASMIQKRNEVTVRTLNQKKIDEEVATLVKLANDSVSGNWGYYPVEEAEARAMAKDLKQILDPKLIFFAENKNKTPIGFALTLPDLNSILLPLKGRLYPFGWIHVMKNIHRIRQFRMWGLGVIPSYQGKAIDLLLYLKTYEELLSRRARLEINYVLEDNHRMNNALRNLMVKRLRTYRVYEMGISDPPHTTHENPEHPII